MEIHKKNIIVTSFDAVSLLAPEIYPVSDRVYETVAEQADKMIRADAEGIKEEYAEATNGLPVNEYLLEDGQLLSAIYNGIYERLSDEADFGKFVKDGTITPETPLTILFPAVIFPARHEAQGAPRLRR